MITAIREVRRAKGLRLAEVAARCVPPTSPQMLSRLETGTRTVSVEWLNRIAAALGVAAADLVRLPDRAGLPVAALLGPEGATAPRRPTTLTPPVPVQGAVAMTVAAGIGDYRAGDELWCEMMAPDAFGHALNRDVLVPRAGGRFAFGRLIGRDAATDGGGGRLHLLPPGPGARQQVVADPPWIARVTCLVRDL